MRVRRSVRRVAVAVALGFAAVAIASTQAAAEGINPCATASGPSAPDWCLEQADGGGNSPPAGTDGESASSGAPEPMECGWTTIPAESVPLNSSRPAMFTNGRPPEGLEVVWQGWCYNPDEALGRGFRGPFRWVPATAAPPVPTAAEVALDAYQAIQGRIPDPTVVTNPPVGVDAIVAVPVFVTVTNWQPELVETRDLLGNVVTVRATPELVVSTAEPDGGARACAGGGRPYDPAAGDMWVQAAAPGACTVTYQRATAVEGRPDRWPSTAMVRWSISWSATSGEGGVFPVVERSVSIARGVDEVAAVVVSGGG